MVRKWLGVKGLALLAVSILGLTATQAMAGVEIAKSSYSVNQGDGSLKVSLVRTQDFTGQVSVSYATVTDLGDNAVAGVNYTETSGTAVWSDLDGASKEIEIPIKKASLNGGSVNFSFKISNPVGTSLGAVTTARIKIVDGTTITPVEFSRGKFVVRNGSNNSSGNGTYVDLSLAGNLAVGAIVNAEITPGSAQPGVDYVDSATFQVGAGGTIRVPLIDNPSSPNTRTFSVTLRPSANYTLGSLTTAQVDIISSVVASNGTLEFLTPGVVVDRDTDTAKLTVQRAGGAAGAVSVTYKTVDGTATSSDGNYKSAIGSLQWAAGDVSPKDILITVLRNGTEEADKAFSVELSNATGGATLGAQSTANVVLLGNQNNAPGFITLLSSSVVASGNGGTAQVFVSRQGGANGEAVVNYVTQGDSAIADQDFKSTSGQLKWDDGDAEVKTISVPIIGDASSAPRSFFVKLSSATSGIVVTEPSTAKVTIAAIESGKVGQVIEIAAGLSPRGWSFMQRYGDRLRYIETDLPAMAACKRDVLERTGSLSERHRIVELDALAVDGPNSLAAVAQQLDPHVGTAIVTEGLMNYLDPSSARAVWQRIAETLGRFPHGVYFSDVYFNERVRHPAVIAFGALLSAFVKGRMHVHFETPQEMSQIMKAASFKHAHAIGTDGIAAMREYAKQRGGDSVRVLEAWV
jgi:O-methyltransferase involved in polyketide biosynthesis